MTEIENKKNIEDTIDVIVVARYFSRKIKSVFGKFFNLFKWIYLFFRKRLWILLSAAVVGFVLGELSTLVFKDKYEGYVVVKASPEIVQKIYREIEYINKIINNDIMESKYGTLGLTLDEFDHVKSYEVEPVDNLYERKKLYELYLSKQDSSTTSNDDFNAFNDKLDPLDFPTHKVMINVVGEIDYRKAFDYLLEQFSPNKEVEARNVERERVMQEHLEMYKKVLGSNDTIMNTLLTNYAFYTKTSAMSGESYLALSLIDQCLLNQTSLISKIDQKYSELESIEGLTVVDEYLEYGINKPSYRKMILSFSIVLLVLFCYLIIEIDKSVMRSKI